jgi:hypothetical protein
MANLDLSTVELVSTLRAAPQNGSPSSQDYNDSWTEALADLAALSGFLNDILIPMMDGLAATIMPNPNGSPSGIEGRYVFSDTSDLTPLFFDALASQPLTLADSLRIIQGVVQTIQVSIGTLNVEVTALQTQLSSTNQNDIAQALQNFAASLQSLTSQTVANTTAITDTIPQFKTDGVLNTVQSTLNLVAGASVTLTNLPSSGDVQIDVTGVVDLKTNNSLNSDQGTLNLKSGTGILVTSGAGGDVTIANTAVIVNFETNNTPNGSQSILNLKAGSDITLSESAGAVTISFSGAGGARQTASTINTGSITDGTVHSGTVTLAKSFLVLKLVVNVNSRIRLYSSTASRDADVSRLLTTPPDPATQNGVICDIELNGVTGLTWFLNPTAVGSDSKSTPDGIVGYNITNQSGITQAVTCDITYLGLES